VKKCCVHDILVAAQLARPLRQFMTAVQLKKGVTGAARTAGGTTTGTGPAAGPSAISERYNTHQDKIIRKILKLMPPLLEISINRRQSTQRRGEKEEKPLEMSTNKKNMLFSVSYFQSMSECFHSSSLLLL
jgi:hypothetical protein